jgi:hypothetical protein
MRPAEGFEHRAGQEDEVPEQAPHRHEPRHQLCTQQDATEQHADDGHRDHGEQVAVVVRILQDCGVGERGQQQEDDPHGRGVHQHQILGTFSSPATTSPTSSSSA